MNNVIVINEEKFKSFVECISMLKEYCNDVDIVNGKIRQRSNDRTVIFDINLSDIFDNVDISISSLKQKFEIFKLFNQDVSFDIDENKYSISDQYLIIDFMKPVKEYLDNKFINDESLTSMFTLDDNNVLFEHEIPSSIVSKIKIISNNFNTNIIKCNFNGETCSFILSTKSKDQKAKVLDGVILNREIEEKYCNIVITPFLIESSDMKVILYDDKERNQLITKFETKINNISVIIYSRSNFIDEGEI